MQDISVVTTALGTGQERIDLQLLDVKSGSPETCKRMTQHPLEPTLAHARRQCDLGRPVRDRFVLVPGLTDDFDKVGKVADVFAGIRFHARVGGAALAPDGQRQVGSDKWAQLGVPYPLAGAEPPTPELTERVRTLFCSRGLTTH